jgi:two-component system, sensor histidine kinase and response regulator
MRISVRDTGIGLSDAARGKLFQPFTQADNSTTRKYGGTGLGLSICKRLVELMDGEIGVDSIPGEGSTFWFVARLERGAAKGRAAAPLRVVRALVVDDHRATRQALAADLATWGIQVEQAADASLAMAHLDAASQAGALHDLVLVDQQMPVVDGLHLARRIRREPRYAGVRMLLLRSHGTRHEGARRPAGFDGALKKPVRQVSLYNALRDLGHDADFARDDELADSDALPPSLVSQDCRVLIAEDNPLNQEVAAYLLEKVGIHAVCVGDGIEAVQAIERAPYDVIFMDCQMPELDGYAATARIRELEGSIRRTYIVAMTAHAMPGDRDKCIAAGMDDYVAKPLTFESMRAVLERYALRGERQEQTGAVPASAPAAEPAMARIASRLLEVAKDNPATLQRLKDLYLSFVEEQIVHLGRAVRENAAEEIERIAHRCIGASSTAGMNQIAELFGQMERVGRDRNLRHAPRVLERIDAEFTQVRTFLDALQCPGALPRAEDAEKATPARAS